LKKPIAELQRADFPLPTLGPVLRRLAENIYNGTGVQILRGFPIQDYNKEDRVLVFLGINSWIGDRRLDQGARKGIVHIKVSPRDHDELQRLERP
jgi:hypothetical protein